MFFSFFKPTKLAQISFAFLASISIFFFNPNIELGVLFFSSFLIFFFIFLLCVLIISKNLYYTNNNFSSLAVIYFTFFLIDSEIKASAYISSFFLIFTLRKIYLLTSEKRVNAKLFDIGFWFAISVIASYYSILFTPTLLFGIFLFFKMNVKTLGKVLTGVLAATSIFLFTKYLLPQHESYTNFLNFPEFHFSTPDNQLIVILLFISALFCYYIFKNFSKNLKTRTHNFFVIVYFLNSLALVLISKDLFIFLLFPFLISFSNIISKLKHKLVFELTSILILFVIYYV